MLCTGQVMAKDPIYKFWIQFTDKNHNSYSLENPGEFLSQRAILRRDRQNIPITAQDLPVSGAYMDSLSVHPLKILYTSRWMNAAIIQTADSGLAKSLPGYSYIESVEYLYRNTPGKKSAINKWDIITNDNVNSSSEPNILSEASMVSDNQVVMLNGHILHQEGFTGQGIHIAVLDLGFPNVNTIAGFDSLFLTGRILGTRNFVEPDSGFYWTSNGSHGTNVFSIMGGNIPGEFRGSAPGASYWLIQTEDVNSEFRIEEANWLAGAELADSAGVDIINSSLGYLNVFTDTAQNYSFSDLDGKTALITRAAQLAATKGILVVTSAGNSGRPGNSWGHISTPADGDSVLAIAAVDGTGNRGDFSSRGPTFDGRIKPDVAAQGVATWLINKDGNTESGNGTSYSSPVVAGLVACLWQKNPEISNTELMDVIRQSSSQSHSPDTLLGYGIPDFAKADELISGISPAKSPGNKLIIYPNPARDYITLISKPGLTEKIQFQVYDISGRLTLSGEVTLSGR